MLGSKTVISKSTSKITFHSGNLLDTLSLKALKRKFQRETNPETKKRTVQLDGWPSWTERATSLADGRAESNALPARRMAELGRSRYSHHVRNAPLPRLYRTPSCFISIGVAIGAL